MYLQQRVRVESIRRVAAFGLRSLRAPWAVEPLLTSQPVRPARETDACETHGTIPPRPRGCL
jgi:hypothetical protein